MVYKPHCGLGQVVLGYFNLALQAGYEAQVLIRSPERKGGAGDKEHN